MDTKKIVAGVMLGTALSLGLVGCGEANNTSTNSTQQEQKQEETYQSILDDYTKQLEDKAPQLVDQYNEEAKDLSSVTDKAQLSNELVQQLAAISNEGVEKMAQLMQKNGDEYSTYQDWATKLQNVYTEQASLIQNAYTKDSTDTILK